MWGRGAAPFTIYPDFPVVGVALPLGVAVADAAPGSLTAGFNTSRPPGSWAPGPGPRWDPRPVARVDGDGGPLRRRLQQFHRVGRRPVVPAPARTDEACLGERGRRPRGELEQEVAPVDGDRRRDGDCRPASAGWSPPGAATRSRTRCRTPEDRSRVPAAAATCENGVPDDDLRRRPGGVGLGRVLGHGEAHRVELGPVRVEVAQQGRPWCRPPTSGSSWSPAVATNWPSVSTNDAGMVARTSGPVRVGGRGAGDAGVAAPGTPPTSSG